MARLRISEIFYSLQGEADTAGIPTVFVRLTGCPLRCQYCDTEYAFQGGEWWDVEAVVQRVRELGRRKPGGNGCASGEPSSTQQGEAGQDSSRHSRSEHENGGLSGRYVCVTGGEPLAQKGCLTLLTRLCDAGCRVSLETSGAMSLEGVDERVVRVVDVKTPGSGEEQRNRYEELARLGPQDLVKFVICDRSDYEWSCAKFRELGLEGRCTVLFSPSHEQLPARQLADWILEDRLPVRFQVQLHKYLWGNVPGK